MEKFTSFFTENPQFVGLFIAAVGILIMVGAILRWKWIIGGDNTTTRTGLFGYIIYKLFGRRVFFIVTGALIALLGAAWFILLPMLAS